MLSSTLRRILDTLAHAQRTGKQLDRISFTPRDRERIDTLVEGGFVEVTGDNRRFLAITRKGDDARRPPPKSLRSIG